MRVADEHRAGAEQIVDILVAADIGDAAGAALADHDVGRHVAEAAGRENPARRLHEVAFGIASGELGHCTYSSSRSRRLILRNSDEHTSEHHSLMRTLHPVICLKIN